MGLNGHGIIKKYFALHEFGFVVQANHPGPRKGRFAVVTKRGSGCGGRGRRRRDYAVAGRLSRARERCALRTTNDAGAYGKTVWSWLSLLQSSFRGDASARPGLMHRQSAKRRRQERIRLRGELGISRHTTAQGRPGCLGCPSGFPLCFPLRILRTAGHGCQPAPGLPCALGTNEGNKRSKARAEHAARMPMHVGCLRSGRMPPQASLRAQ